MRSIRQDTPVSIRRLARASQEASSTLGTWVGQARAEPRAPRRRPVADDPNLRLRVRALCEEPRNRTFGYRRIWALLRREGFGVNRKSVGRIMREEGLCRARVRRREARPRRVERMSPERPNQAWQIDMTSFQLSNMTPLYLVVATDCCTRQIVGWTLERRCRAGEWTSAVRMALEARRLTDKEKCKNLVLRSDNGSQPCSKAFVEFLGKTGVRGQYTGYNAPDDNAYVERTIRTIKEEEIWPNAYDTFFEAHKAIDEYVKYYNERRIHSAIGYRTPNEEEARHITLNAA